VKAVQRRPDLFYAYVDTGQLLHRDRQEQISYDWVMAQARQAGDQEALAELATIHPPYTRQTEFKLQRHWLSKYHGDEFAVDRVREFLPAKLFGREYTLGTRLHVDPLSQVRRLEVPVFIFLGRHDFNTPTSLVEEWASRLQAPRVEIVWFESAGHFLAAEAPEEFQQRLVEKLLPLARN
jgi:proline iminopeptidase